MDFSKKCFSMKFRKICLHEFAKTHFSMKFQKHSSIFFQKSLMRVISKIMYPWNFQKSSPKIQYNSGHFKAPTQHVSSQGRQPPDDSSAYIEVHGIVLNLQHVHVVNVDYAFFLYLEGLLKNHIR